MFQNWSEIRAIEYLLIHKNVCTKRAKLCKTQVSTSIPGKLSCSPNKSLETPKIHIGDTHRCPTPLPGKRSQTFQHVKSSANRETQPHFVHVSQPARTQEYNVDTIREEIKSYLASALHLFEQLPSGPKATGHPGTQSYKSQSNNAHSLSAKVSQCTTPQLPCLPIKIPTLVEAQAAENTPRKQYLALRTRSNCFSFLVLMF